MMEKLQRFAPIFSYRKCKGLNKIVGKIKSWRTAEAFWLMNQKCEQLEGVVKGLEERIAALEMRQ